MHVRQSLIVKSYISLSETIDGKCWYETSGILSHTPAALNIATNETAIFFESFSIIYFSYNED